MSVLWILLLSGIVSISLAGKINNLQSRILNGENATLGEIPFIVALQDDNYIYGVSQHRCAGVILDKNYVLTAAHCAIDAGYDTLVFAGTIDLQNPLMVRKVVERDVHPEYTPSDSYRNDIAVLKVDPPFEFSQTVAPATLPDPDGVFDDKIAVVAGWGKLHSYWKDASRFLQKTNLPIVSNRKCRDDMKGKNKVYEKQMCAYDLTEGNGLCTGDDGDPLIVDGVVVGLASYTLKLCATYNTPNVFTRVSEYISWIKEHTK